MAYGGFFAALAPPFASCNAHLFIVGFLSRVDTQERAGIGGLKTLDQSSIAKRYCR
jgi:hypothetical protein